MDDRGIKPLDPAFFGEDLVAARFLLCLARHFRIAKDTIYSPEILKAAVLAVGTLKNYMVDDESLTIARESYRMRFFVSNVEVYAALVEFGDFCSNYPARSKSAKVKDPKAKTEDIKNRGDLDIYSTEALLMADRTALALRDYLQGEYISTAKGDTGFGAFDSSKIQTISNIYGLTYLGTALDKVKSEELWKATALMKTDTDDIAIAPKSRWLPAIARLPKTEKIQGKTITGWRKDTVEEATKFDGSMYVLRPAYVVLGLLDGPASLPELLYPKAQKVEK